MKKILLLFILIITGCTKYNDLDELTIIKSIGLSYDKQYKLYAQIIDEIDENNEPKMKVIEIDGESVKKVFYTLEETINKEIFLSHIDLMVFDKKLKNNNYHEIIKYLVNNNNFRNDFYCIFSDDTNKLLRKSKYDEIEIFLKTNIKKNNIVTKNFNDVAKDFIENKKIILPTIIYNDEIKYLGNYEYGDDY